MKMSGMAIEYFRWLKEKKQYTHETGWKMDPKLFLEKYFHESKQIK
jgi:hypothetical protein